VSIPPNSVDRSDRFMRAYSPLALRLERFCAVLTGNREDAADLVGDTVEQAFIAFDEVRDEQAFLSFLFTIASRRWSRQRHRKRLFVEMLDEHFDTLFDTSYDVERITEARLVFDAVQRLPAALREALVLCEVFDHTAREAAAVIGCTETLVRVRLFRAKARLRTALGVGNAKSATLSQPILETTQ